MEKSLLIAICQQKKVSHALLVKDNVVVIN